MSYTSYIFKFTLRMELFSYHNFKKNAPGEWRWNISFCSFQWWFLFYWTLGIKQSTTSSTFTELILVWKYVDGAFFDKACTGPFAVAVVKFTWSLLCWVAIILTPFSRKSWDLFHILSFRSFTTQMLEGLGTRLRMGVPHTQVLNKILKIGYLPSVCTETQRTLGIVCLRLWDADVRFMRDNPLLSWIMYRKYHVLETGVFALSRLPGKSSG